MEIRIALPEDFLSVREFYYDLIDAMEDAEYKPLWKKEIYPDSQMLKEHVNKGELYIGYIGPEIVAAVVLNHSYNEGYDAVDWEIEAVGEEILMIHLLGVMPKHARRGLGKEMVRYAEKIAGEKGCKVMRLDVLAGNVPAERLYPSMGFVLKHTLNMFYEDTGLTSFELYEKVVK